MMYFYEESFSLQLRIMVITCEGQGGHENTMNSTSNEMLEQGQNIPLILVLSVTSLFYVVCDFSSLI